MKIWEITYQLTYVFNGVEDKDCDNQFCTVSALNAEEAITKFQNNITTLHPDYQNPTVFDNDGEKVNIETKDAVITSVEILSETDI